MKNEKRRKTINASLLEKIAGKLANYKVIVHVDETASKLPLNALNELCMYIIIKQLDILN